MTYPPRIHNSTGFPTARHPVIWLRQNPATGEWRGGLDGVQFTAKEIEGLDWVADHCTPHLGRLAGWLSILSDRGLGAVTLNEIASAIGVTLSLRERMDVAA